MLHQLRIPVIGFMVCILCQPFVAVTAGTDSQSATDLRERSALLAGQLASLRDEAASVSPVQSPKLPDKQALFRRAKTELLASTLDNLIVEQQSSERTVESTRNLTFRSINQQNPLLPQLSGLSLMAIEEDLTEAVDVPEPVAEDAGSSDLEDVDLEEVLETPGPPPLPPAPRVQTTPEVKDANISLVTERQSMVTDAQTITGPEGTAQPTVAEVVLAREPVRPRRTWTGDPLDQLVNIDFRGTDLTHVVAILALKADINIIAGADLRGTVTANLQQVPLRVAMETVLRMNGLGIVEEEGIYFIVPYEEAASVNRKTTMVTLEKAKVDEVKRVLDDVIRGVRDEAVISVSANKTANVLVISAPKNRVDELVAMAHQLDVAEPVLPTITEAISLNYSEPAEMLPLIESMLTPRIGQAASDKRARHLVVTDVPVVVEQIKELVRTVDIPTKQVLIETMVVDAILSDEADTGVQWLINSLHRQSRREAALGESGRSVGNLQNLGLLADMPVLQNPGSVLTFSVLTDNFDWTGLIQMEVRNRNGRLVSNPVLLTLENETAEISISQELPYTELTQTAAGGQQTSTRFKEIGTVLSVTPRVTHDNTIICSIEGKESTTTGTFQGIPIEDKREISSTMRMGNGQTIFIGGLRKSDGSSNVKKIPVLGDVPIINFMFRSTQRQEQINELLVFLTCTVIDQHPNLTPYQKDVLETAPPVVPYVDAWDTIMHDTVCPHDMKELQMRWRRGT